MVTQTLLWTVRAAKQLRKLEPQHQALILARVTGLAHMPECQHVRALINAHYGYRLRTGRYRILFDWNTDGHTITIGEIKIRDEHTYR